MSTYTHEPSEDAKAIARDYLKFTPDQKLETLELQFMRALADYTDWLQKQGFFKEPTTNKYCIVCGNKVEESEG